MWIKRDLSPFLKSNKDCIQVLNGPRQCGKSSLLLKLREDFEELSLDELSLRELAQKDPELFLNQFSNKKILIDEAQYAPELFPILKRKIDLYKRECRENNKSTETIFAVTGSNQILLDRDIKESLAGRASFFELNTLSVHEILAFEDYSIQEILYKGGWPELYIEKNKEVKKYLDDYISSYIEKDIILSAGIKKHLEFLKLLKLLAGRVGEILDVANLSRDLGVDSKTIKDWISILEKMKVIALLKPYSTNLSSRLVKSPKIYFLDTGLACRLQGWTSHQPILTSPQQGHLFENLVFSELYKMNINLNFGWSIYFWRSRAGEEIDFLIQKDRDEFIFVEAKVTKPKSYHHDYKNYPEVRKVFNLKEPTYIVCHQEGERVFMNHVPIKFLQKYFSDSL